MSSGWRSVAVGRTALRYRLAGPGGGGEPVLLLHPWFGCAAFWDEVASAISGRLVYVLDLYSPGEHDWRGLDGPEGLATAVLALLDAEAIPRCALIGNSTGGVAAQLVAIAAPERVGALVLIGTGASTGGVHADYRAEVDAWLAADPDGSRSAALVRRLLARDPPPQRMAAFVDALRRADRAYMVRTLEGVLALDLRPRLPEIRARTLVIRGTLDAARTRQHVRALLAGIAGAVAIEIEGAGHSPMVDSPALLTPMLQAFLEGREVRGAGRELLQDCAATMAQRSALAGGLDSARVYDLAHPLEAATPVSRSHPPFRIALMRRHGDAVREDGMSGANELMTLGGHNGTHIDALCHVALDGRLHGGVDAAEASRGGRFSAHGIETIAPILCRGVLLDVPALDGRGALDAAEAVTAEHLARACEAEGVSVGTGDAVLVRTGWPVDHYASEELMLGHASGVPGPDVSAANWLAERGVRVTGSDTIAYEQLAPGMGHTRLPVHVILLVEHGIHIIEVLDLEQLGRDRVHEFWFVAAPLKIVGATGSPLRPLAIVP